ncbi:MAG: rpmC [Rickettsiaceae bacterium]|jgi:large subunit ribosomal protein L29|nr:rpmC [Rickettsiaceae bacterium]
MKISELRGKTVDQLKDLLLSLKKESFNLRFQKTTGELEKTGRIRQVRRTIAKVNTLLSEAANKESANA